MRGDYFHGLQSDVLAGPKRFSLLEIVIMATAKTGTRSTAKKTSAPKAAAKPGTKDDKGKKGEKPAKATKVTYDVPEGGLTEVPEDYDPKQHKPLKKADFKEEWTYLEFQASIHEAKAAALHEKAAESKKLGSSKDRAKKKKLLTLQKRLNELAEELAGQGVDVDDLLGDDEE